MAEGGIMAGNQPANAAHETITGNTFAVSIGKSENVVIGNNSKLVVYTSSKSRGHRKKENIVPKYPVTKSTEQLTRAEKLEIKGKVGRRWKDLGRRLGFETAELEQMELDFKHDMSELIYQIITKWEQRCPESATKANLATVFIKIKRGDLADILATKS